MKKLISLSLAFLAVASVSSVFAQQPSLFDPYTSTGSIIDVPAQFMTGGGSLDVTLNQIGGSHGSARATTPVVSQFRLMDIMVPYQLTRIPFGQYQVIIRKTGIADYMKALFVAPRYFASDGDISGDGYTGFSDLSVFLRYARLLSSPYADALYTQQTTQVRSLLNIPLGGATRDEKLRIYKDYLEK